MVIPFPIVGSILIRVANSKGIEWGTKDFKWGTCGVQFFAKWGTLMGYIIYRKFNSTARKSGLNEYFV